MFGPFIFNSFLRVRLCAWFFVAWIFRMQLVFGQGLHALSILPANPTTSDTLLVVSDFSYYGNCAAGLVDLQFVQNDSLLSISAVYCGYNATTLCNSIDTFNIGVLPQGNYSINIRYHQGSTCPISSFDTIIAQVDTSIEVGALTAFSYVFSDRLLHVFPNPADRYIHIQTTQNIDRLQLFDSFGNTIVCKLRGDFMDIQFLPAGLYILKIQLDNGQVVTKKIVKRSSIVY